MNKELDMIDVMREIKMSINFYRTFLSRERRIMLMFNNSNVIDSEGFSENQDEEVSDLDRKLVQNLSNKNKLAQVFAMAEL